MNELEKRLAELVRVQRQRKHLAGPGFECGPHRRHPRVRGGRKDGDPVGALADVFQEPERIRGIRIELDHHQGAMVRAQHLRERVRRSAEAHLEIEVGCRIDQRAGGDRSLIGHPRDHSRRLALGHRQHHLILT
jgi:hypothetical protein